MIQKTRKQEENFDFVINKIEKAEKSGYWTLSKEQLLAKINTNIKMNSYILTKDAEEDLDRIHEFGVYKFGMQQADKYYELLFDSFERIAKNP